MSSNSNSRKAKRIRLTRESREHAAPYPIESDSIVFVSLSKNAQATAQARQNVQDRLNRRITRSMSRTHTDSLELLRGHVSRITDIPKNQEQPSEMPEIDDATSSNNLDSQDSQSSLETITGGYVAHDKESESSSSIGSTDMENDDACDEEVADDVMSENLSVKSEDPEQHTDTNITDNGENAADGGKQMEN